MGSKPQPWPEHAEVIVSMIGGPAVLADFGIDVRPDDPIVGHLKFGWPMNRVDASRSKSGLQYDPPKHIDAKYRGTEIANAETQVK
jgi:hypothetical protein